MRQSPRFLSAAFVRASVMGTDYRTMDISEKGVKLQIAPSHPFRVGGEYVFYLFISDAPDSPAESAWSVMGECRWIADDAAGFAFSANSFVEREIAKILHRTPFSKAPEPDQD